MIFKFLHIESVTLISSPWYSATEHVLSNLSEKIVTAMSVN